jgi:hypothetical protein
MALQVVSVLFANPGLHVVVALVEMPTPANSIDSEERIYTWRIWNRSALPNAVRPYLASQSKSIETTEADLHASFRVRVAVSKFEHGEREEPGRCIWGPKRGVSFRAEPSYVELL